MMMIIIIIIIIIIKLRLKKLKLGAKCILSREEWKRNGQILSKKNLMWDTCAVSAHLKLCTWDIYYYFNCVSLDPKKKFALLLLEKTWLSSPWDSIPKWNPLQIWTNKNQCS